MQEVAGRARAPGLVTVGLPIGLGVLPGAALGNPAALSVEGIEVLQTRVLQLWPDGSARWVLLKFQADFQAGERRAFAVGIRTKAPLTPPFAVARSSADRIEIDTGPMQFHCARGPGFRLFESVRVDGRVVTGHSDHSGLVLHDASGRAYHGRADTVELLENGPVQAVVEVRGRFVDEDGTFLLPIAARPNEALEIRYSLYLYAAAGSTDVRTICQLHNPGSNDLKAEEGGALTIEGIRYSMADTLKQWLYFQDFVLQVPLPGDAADQDLRLESEVGEQEFAVQRSVSLRQWFTPEEPALDALQRFRSQLVVGGEPTTRQPDGRSEGWLGVRGPGGALGAGVQYFWQNWPMSLGIHEGVLEVGLFPDLPPEQRAVIHYAGVKDLHHVRSAGGGRSPTRQEDIDIEDRSTHVLQGGRAKAHNVVFHFGGRGSTRAALADLREPLVGVPDADYLFASGALPDFFPGRMQLEDPVLNEAVAQRLRWRYALIDPAVAAGPKKRTIEGQRIAATTGGWAHHFGHANYGDLSWGASPGRYSNLHYDWPYGLLMDFLRYGDPRFFAEGDRMARYRREWGQYHHKGGLCWADGLAWYEKSDHAYEPERPRLTHNWNGGLALHYLLTGEELSLQALRENADGVYAAFFWGYRLGPRLESRNVRTASREQGWSILALMNAYELTLEPRYLEQSRRIFVQNTLHTLEELGGMQGYLQKHGLLMFAYCIPGFIRFHQCLPPSDPLRPRIVQLLAELADAIERPRFKTEPEGELRMGATFRPPMYRDPWGKPSATYAIFFSDLFAFLWQEAEPHDGLLLRCRQNLYTGFVHQARRESTVIGAIETYPPPSFATATSGQTTKELGWMGLFGSYALRTQYRPTQVPELRP